MVGGAAVTGGATELPITAFAVPRITILGPGEATRFCGMIVRVATEVVRAITVWPVAAAF